MLAQRLQCQSLISAVLVFIVFAVCPSSFGSAKRTLNETREQDQVKYSFIDKSGAVIFSLPVESNCDYFSDGRLLVDDHFLDINGRPVLAKFQFANSFSDGVAVVRDRGLGGAIDIDGRPLINPRFEHIRKFSEGLAPVLVAGRVGFIDKVGNLVIDPFYENAAGFSDGLAAVQVQGKIGFIDKAGGWKILPKYDRVTGFVDGLAFVEQAGKVFFVNKTGLPVINVSAEQDKWQRYSGWAESSLRAIDPNDDPLWEIFSVGTYNFSEGLCPMWSKGKFGYIDKTGKFVIAPKFDAAFRFSGGLASVMVGSKYGYVDKTGAFVVKPKFSNARAFSEGAAAVAIERERWGYIDKTGRLIVPYKYVDCGPFKNNRARVQLSGPVTPNH